MHQSGVAFALLLHVIFESQAIRVALAQRNAAQATPGMPTASRLNAGLVGFNLFQLILLPFHADAHSKWGFVCGN